MHKAQYLFTWLAAPSLMNPVDLRKCCFGCLFIDCYVFAKKKTKLFGAVTLHHKESRKKTKAASEKEKVAKVRIVVRINTGSVQDEQCVHLFHTPRTAQYFLQLCSSNESNCHVIISFLVKIHFRSTSNPPTRGGLPGSQSDLHKSTYTKTHKYEQDWTRSDRNSITIETLVRTGLNSWCRVLQRSRWLQLKALRSSARNTSNSHLCHTRCSFFKG